MHIMVFKGVCVSDFLSKEGPLTRNVYNFSDPLSRRGSGDNITVLPITALTQKVIDLLGCDRISGHDGPLTQFIYSVILIFFFF